MLTPWRTSRILRSIAVLLLTCLYMAVSAPLARADYEAGKRALEAGQPDKAAAEWHSAALGGDRRAMLALGRLYARGLGVVQDYVEAHKWFNLAASRGEAEAARERDAVAAKMTPVQVAGAQEKAKAWRPRAGRATSTPAEPGTAAPAGSRDAAAIEVSLGLTPADRRLIQSGLASLGFRPGPADGVFGVATRAALRAWQRANGAAETGRLTASAAAALAAAGERAAKARQAAREEAEKAAREKAEKAAREEAEKATREKVARECPDLTGKFYAKFGNFITGEITVYLSINLDQSVDLPTYHFAQSNSNSLPKIPWYQDGLRVNKTTIISDDDGRQKITTGCKKNKLLVETLYLEPTKVGFEDLNYPFTEYSTYSLLGQKLIRHSRIVFDPRDRRQPAETSDVFLRTN